MTFHWKALEAQFLIMPSVEICDRLWENPAKVARQNTEKRGKGGIKVKNKTKFFFFLVKMPF
jgi:hypothetical protein